MLADTTTDAGAGAGLLLWYIVLYVIGALAFYGIFKKANKTPWAAFVPFYNFYILLEVVGPPGLVADPLLHPDREPDRLHHRV